MKKSKIALKLALNFAVALLIFSLLIGGVFLFLFRNYTMDLHKDELRTYAQSLAETLSVEDKRTSRGSGGAGGYGSYLRFISEVADIDIWIVDENLEFITTNTGQGSKNHRYNLSDLPPNASELIDDVFRGETVFSEDFSGILSQSMLTVGSPIVDQQGNIWGAVLLHSPVEGTTAAIQQGLSIVGISILLALVITSILSFALSYSFTKPLSKMQTAALRLARGDYTARCGVAQRDEIGDLSEVLDTLALRLDEASKQSEKLEQMRRDFVANISHELRTPIAVMRGSLEALQDKVVTDPQKVEEYYTQMLNEARFLERLVGDLLDLSRLQNVDFVIEMDPVSLGDVLSDVSRSALQLAKKKNVEIHTALLEPAGIVLGDYGRLRQMFLIVLDNAIKFSPPDSRVDVTLEDSKVTIRDYGPGIAEEHLPHIFDRFYKTHGEKNKSGTGLGLAIAKQIADRHHIGLTASNASEGGALFTFALPPTEDAPASE